jgi:hypothetical protein
LLEQSEYYKYNTPGIIYFDINGLNTTLLADIRDKTSSVSTEMLYFFIKEPINIKYITSDGSYYAISEINTVKVIKSSIVELQDILQNKMHILDDVDMGTGAGYSIIITTLWTLLVNKQIQHTRLGEAIIVIPDIVQSPITERIIVKTVSLITSYTKIHDVNPRFAFMLDFVETQGNKLSGETHKMPLQFIHQGLCRPSLGTICNTGVIISTYNTKYVISQLHLNEDEKSILAKQQKFRSIFFMFGPVHLSLEIPCPRYTFTVDINKDYNIRTCQTCDSKSFAAQYECESCDDYTDNTTELCSNEWSMLPNKCSFTMNAGCIECDLQTGCPIIDIEICRARRSGHFSVELCNDVYS